MKFHSFVLLLIISFWGNTVFAQSSVTASPNPFEDEITLTTTAHCGDSLLFEIYNMSGQIMIRHQEKIAYQPDTFIYQLSLPEGVYLTRITTDTTSAVTKVIRANDSGPATIRFAFTNVSCSDQPFEIFPNPSPDGIFKIRQVDIKRSYELEIFDISGKRIWQETVKNRTEDLHLTDLSAAPKGTYSIRIKSSGEEFTSRIILH